MMKSLLVLLIIIATTTGTQTGNSADYDAKDWTGSVELADLLHTETVIMENLRNYVNAMDSKIGAIKRRMQEIRAIYDVALEDTNKYFGNPINTLTLIRRMTYDWPAIRNLAWKDVTGHIIENITVYSEFLTFPNDEDLDEAVGSLLKIQDVYQMEPSHVALGEFNGMKFGSQMTWSDCFAIGQQSFRQGDHLVAKVWLQTALEKFPKNNVGDILGNKVAKMEILEIMSNAEYQSGNLKEALRITEEILELNPKNKRAIAAQATFREKLKRKSMKPRKTKPQKSTEELLAQEVCRGTSEQYTSSSLPRTCTFHSTNSPSLRIAPVKLETVSVDPFIAIYHGIYNDTEIENFKNFLSNAENGKLPNEYSERLEQVTGLTGKKFKEWKPVKSHFYDEIDFQQGALMTEKEKGVGVAYIQLNEPKLGGSIAFPQLEMKVDIPRGSMLYWSIRNEFNEVDYRTKQFMCPVIAGTLEAARTSVR